MPANVFGDRMAYKGATPWHGLGTPVTEPITASEGLRVARIDYGVEKLPLWYQSPTTGIATPTSQVALVRPAWDGEPEAILGFASDAYTPLQNSELAKLLDPLTREWPLETIGALGNGETVFMTLDAGTAEVGGDEIRQYLFAYNGHDGSTAFKINITPIRVVCANTCATGLRQATVSADVVHTRAILAEAELAINLVARLRAAQDETLDGLRGLTKIHVPYDQLKRILEAVYPTPEESARLERLEAHEAGEIVLPDAVVAKLMKVKIDTEHQRARAYTLQMAALDQLEQFNDERPSFANTGWAVYNAVTATEGWREGGTDQQLLKSVVMGGERAKRMAVAYRELVALAN